MNPRCDRSHVTNPRLTAIWKFLKPGWIAGIALLGSLLATDTGDACCSAYPRDRPVLIARQQILVAWNPDTKLEHFVRRAVFNANGNNKDFGFLVPTPARPMLAEAPDSAFDLLADAAKPAEYTEVENKYFFSIFTLPRRYELDVLTKSFGSMSAAAPVNVLEEVRIAGYDAAILEASDPAALTKWLGEHGYDARAQITDWVAPYITAKWIVTAFKYSRDQTPGQKLETAAIRMTFKTDRPLFPYRVPSDQRGGSETLRVYYVGNERVDGKLGEKGLNWRRELKFSAKVASLEAMLENIAPPDQLVRGDWLTAFEDHHWPGGAEDLYFSPDSEKATYIPPPIIHYARPVYVPLDAALLIAICVSIAIARKRRNQPA